MKYTSILILLLVITFAVQADAAVIYGRGTVNQPTGSTPDNLFVFPTQVQVATTSVQNTVQASSSIQSPVFFFYSYLKPGSRGKEVSELQKRLIDEKYMTGPITGFFGSKTFNAVLLFQKENGISSVGFVGPLTRAVLNAR